MKEIRSAGGNLTKIWHILNDLKAEMQDSTFPLDFPDPLPAPSNGSRSTRSTRLVTIATSAQMVTVVSGLIKCLLPCDVVRAELAEASADGKDVWRDSRDATKKENERFEVEKEKLEAGGEAEVISVLHLFQHCYLWPL
jgi:hypothetical protein